MTIDRPHPDILVFNPPPQSIKDFRMFHRSLTILLMMALVVGIAVFIFTAIYLFNFLLRYEIYYTNSKLFPILLISFFATFIATYNAILIYVLLNLRKPVLLQSCTFDRSSGQLSIQQYNLFDRHPRPIEMPLSTIVDIQVRNYSVQLADDFVSISLMTRQSIKPIYIFQRSIPKQIPLPIMKSLLTEVATIRDFLHLPSEPPCKISDYLNWDELMLTVPTPTERLKSIDQNNDTLICTMQYKLSREIKI